MIKYKKYLFLILLTCLFFPYRVFATSSDIGVNIKNQSDVYTYDNFYVSNFSRVESGTLENAIPYFDTRQLLVGNNCGINGRSPCRIYPAVDNDISSSGSIKRNFLVDIGEPVPESYYYGPIGDKAVMSMKFWTNKDYSHLEFNKNYQIAFTVQKDSALYFGGQALVHIAITDNDNPTGAINVDSIVDSSFRRVAIDENNSLFVINFKFDTNQHVYNFSDFSLNNIEITTILSESELNGETYITPYVPVSGYSFLLQNTSYNNPYYYKITNFYFLEDGFVSVGGEYVQPDNTLSDDIPDDYTTLSPDDLNIYDADTYCAPTDLMCHINNIIRNIKNVFEKIGRSISSVIQKITDLISSIFQSIVSALQNLFIPSNNFINTFFSNQYELLQSKLGFLLSPFTLIANLLNRFINIEPNHVISYNGFTLPIFNVAILPSFTFDFVSFFNESPELATMYSYYRVGVVAIIYILFLNLCYKKFKSLIGGDSA